MKQLDGFYASVNKPQCGAENADAYRVVHAPKRQHCTSDCAVKRSHVPVYVFAVSFIVLSVAIVMYCASSNNGADHTNEQMLVMQDINVRSVDNDTTIKSEICRVLEQCRTYNVRAERASVSDRIKADTLFSQISNIDARSCGPMFNAAFDKYKESLRELRDAYAKAVKFNEEADRFENDIVKLKVAAEERNSAKWNSFISGLCVAFTGAMFNAGYGGGTTLGNTAISQGTSQAVSSALKPDMPINEQIGILNDGIKKLKHKARSDVKKAQDNVKYQLRALYLQAQDLNVNTDKYDF